MTGLELLELVIEHGPASSRVLAREGGFRDGRALSPHLLRLERESLVRGLDVGYGMLEWRPTVHGRNIAKAVAHARRDGFVPYSQIEGVGFASHVLATTLTGGRS